MYFEQPYEAQMWDNVVTYENITDEQLEKCASQYPNNTEVLYLVTLTMRRPDFTLAHPIWSHHDSYFDAIAMKRYLTELDKALGGSHGVKIYSCARAKQDRSLKPVITSF